MDYAENDTELAVKMGYTKSSFSQIMNEKVPLSDKFINSLVKIDENINIVWINDEEGKMLRTGENLPNKIEIEQLKEENSELKSKLIACYEKMGFNGGDFKSKAS